jgi:dipeptidyl-peptidase-3
MEVFAEKFDDIKILRFEVPGFNQLSLKQKLYVYYLHKATLAGRDILWDQHGKYNLLLRDILESIYQVVKDNDNKDWYNFVIYLKKVWFASGVHHHYSSDKFKPGFSQESFNKWIKQLKPGDHKITEQHLSSKNIELITKLIFNSEFHPKRVNTNPEMDLITTSANNFYENILQQEVEEYYLHKKEGARNKKISFGLNSKIQKDGDKIVEKKYKAGGLYGEAIEHILGFLHKASSYAENEHQKEVIELLMHFYENGDLEIFDQYNIKWVNVLEGEVDFINGFIETYGDPLGMKATWEGLVQVVDKEETQKAKIIAEHAGWFEANAPVHQSFKKDEIKGISLKAINAVILGGDCYPASPLGINLPNAEWIREEYGSKSVTLTNISNAHHKASLSSGFIEEFTLTNEEVALEKKYGALADNLHTHLHECVGHGSGKMMPGVTSDALKSYASVIEETRADLYGLYFIHHPKALELELIPHIDAAKAHYNGYIRNGLLTQITRIKLGNDIEQAHMRNRQLISKWVYENGGGEVISRVMEKGKTYFVVKDYEKLQVLFGELLTEIQRIKSEGDYEAAKSLVENYGVKIELELHKEVLKRFKALDVPPFTGFLNPELTLVYDNEEIMDVEVNYDTDYTQQMLDYSCRYNYLKSNLVD